MTNHTNLIERLNILRAERRRVYEVEGDDVDTALGDSAQAISTLTAEVEELRAAGHYAVLAVVASEAQRRAFVAGYNGDERPAQCSDQMRKLYNRGKQVHAALHRATLTKGEGS